MTHEPPIMAPALRGMCSPNEEQHVESLFSSIASRYDLINSVLSLGLHRAWRRFAVSLARLSPGDRALDVCCGTGDFALELAKAVGSTGTVSAVDFSEPMLEIARQKADRAGFSQIDFVKADACDLPFADNSFDSAVVGFGLRNIAEFGRAIAELNRVVKPGGRIISLEIFGIRTPWASAIWKFYFNIVGPRVARILRGDPEAYIYLPRSVESFATPEEMARQFEARGLENVRWYKLACGAVCVHLGTKPSIENTPPYVGLENWADRISKDFDVNER